MVLNVFKGASEITGAYRGSTQKYVGPGAYAEGGLTPYALADFVSEFYAVNGVKVPLSSALTFTRSGTAQMVNSSGQLVEVADGEPRIGHHIWQDGQLVNAGLAVESEARTNEVLYSEAIAANWSANGTGSPTLTLDGDWTIFSGTDPSDRAHSNNVVVADGEVFTGSVFIDASHEDSDIFDVYCGRSGAQRARVRIEILGGVLTLGAVGDNPSDVELRGVSVTKENGSVYRVSVSAENVSGSPLTFVVGLWRNGSSGGSEEIAFRGAQIEKGATPSTYIPTNGTTVTRAAESARIPAANLPDVWASGTDAITIAMSGTVTYADEDEVSAASFYNWAADSNNELRSVLQTFASDVGQVIFVQDHSAYTQVEVPSAIDALSPGINVPLSICVTHSATGLYAAVNGVELTPNLTPTALADLSAEDLLLALLGFMGAVDKLRVWGDDIGETGRVEVTS